MAMLHFKDTNFSQIRNKTCSSLLHQAAASSEQFYVLAVFLHRAKGRVGREVNAEKTSEF